ncbi:hypothetical protein [Pseudomonas sp. P9_31]|uniref:hypothetical protein n=1 Tax=Pseudomonas sp. P9_31 TaxID=3043448 RepID=UPI002A35DDBB|nr:hypothetical protein [Pseudomonas sp. P9_31]WPN59745.1 hypothetical protein QMK51_09125 [Pseudomonas sp. P9_31]
MLNPDLLYIREDCRTLCIDTTRATISTDRDGYIVTFSKPLVDLGATLVDPPEEVRCSNAAQAEFELLSGCRRIQLAERNKVRAGRVYGWSGSDINRRPLTVEELAEYKAGIEHAATVKRLTRELAAVVEQNAIAAKANAGRAELADRYGLAPAKTPAKPANAGPVPSAKPQRNPSRGSRA